MDTLTTSGCIAVVTMAAAIAPGCSPPSRLAADLVITGASIWTGNPLQSDPRAVAIVGDRIVDVGGAEEIERWRGPNTTVIAADGRRNGFSAATGTISGGRRPRFPHAS